MKYIINYGCKVAVVPEKALEVSARAGAVELRALLGLCALGGSVDIKKLARSLSCSEDDVKSALAFWRGAGVIELGDSKETASDEPAAEAVVASQKFEEKATEVSREAVKKLRRADELPQYTSDQLSDILEQRKETATLIDECQHIMGKVFNVKEINVLMGLVDYLELDCEYIMMLLTYCVSLGKKTLHYAEKLAFALYDAGITTGEQLSEELRRRELASDAEGKIRTLFGVGERAFTTKEKKFISSWINDMNYSIEIIEKAYEVTADATGKGSFPYANTVLERWNAAGLRTLEEIEASYKKSGSEGPAVGSFDTDSFFEAAVRRSLGNN
ncbi:MAG: DnaD domain protein [Clostridia bacterium]|nr:DnaD domain protein [Clostridia bacterium]